MMAHAHAVCTRPSLSSPSRRPGDEASIKGVFSAQAVVCQLASSSISNVTIFGSLTVKGGASESACNHACIHIPYSLILIKSVSHHLLCNCIIIIMNLYYTAYG